MKRKCLVLLLSAVLLVGVTVSTQVSDPQEEEAVMATLQTLFDAYARQDTARVSRIYHDDLSYGHSSASLQTKTEVLKDLHTWAWLKIKSSTVRVSGQSAIVRAIMDLREGPTKARVRTATDMSVLYVLVKGPQGWQVIVRQAVKNPKTSIPPYPDS